MPRRAFDLPLLGRLRSAAWCREARKYVPAIRFRQWSVQYSSGSIIQYEAGVGQTERVLTVSLYVAAGIAAADAIVMVASISSERLFVLIFIPLNGSG